MCFNMDYTIETHNYDLFRTHRYNLELNVTEQNSHYKPPVKCYAARFNQTYELISLVRVFLMSVFGRFKHESIYNEYYYSSHL